MKQSQRTNQARIDTGKVKSLFDGIPEPKLYDDSLPSHMRIKDYQATGSRKAVRLANDGRIIKSY